MSVTAVGAASHTRTALRGIASLASGLLFGLGLSLARMVDPRKVLAFLDVAGDWDPSLLFVFGGALVVALIGYRVVLRQPAPLFDVRFHFPQTSTIDQDLAVGSVLFGVGWGLAGYCPGPAIASLGYANEEALWFVPAMLVGAGLQRWRSRLAPSDASAAIGD